MTTQLSAETRSRILSAAWQRMRDEGLAAVTLADVAREAQVSRQLLYFHFGNRAGLLLAMARHHNRASGFARRVESARALPAVEAFETLVRDWLDYVPELLPVARALEAALITGDVGGGAWRDRMGDLRQVLRSAVARLAEEGRLSAGPAVISR